jgi:predicted component of type VI protein secretion system
MTQQVFKSSLWLMRTLAAFALLMASLACHAQPPSTASEKQIIATVQAQLQAFANDDAEKAFSFAAPNIRSMMLNAENFMDMVRNHYAVVYRPSDVVFLKPKVKGNEAALGVQLTDSDGNDWIAIYTLERQKNKTWRITGCKLTEAAGGMV